MSTATGYWNAGANAVVIGHGPAVDATATALETSGARVVRVGHDSVMNDVAAREAFDYAETKVVGRITVLVFGDRVADPVPADRMALDDWRAVTSINLDARFFCAAELARRLYADALGVAVLRYYFLL